MPTCPVCEKELPEALPPFCDRCGWDLKSDLRLTPFVGDIPESTIEEYKRRLNIAQKSWRKRIRLEAQQKELIAKIKQIQEREQDTSARLETLQAESEKRAKLEARLKSLESELASARRQASRPAPTPAPRPSRGRWLFLMVVALLIGVTVYLVNQYREPGPMHTPPTDAVENESTDAATETTEEKDESVTPADVTVGAVGSESIETSDETIEESEKSGMSIYSQKTAVPSLVRDPFETVPEFKNRIETHPPIPAGEATLIKDKYDIDTGNFPIRMEWRDWITKFARVSNTGDWNVNAERDMARTIFESGPTHPVYVRLKADGEDVLVSVVEMVAGEWVFKVEGTVQGKKGGKSVSPDHHVIKLGKSKVPMRFVYIPPGEFMMGSPEDEPGRFDRERQHKVILTEGFFIQETPVTQAQWEAVMGNNPSYFKECGPECPVENVSWDDAKEFLDKLNRKGGDYEYRLPTEAQWEYACRAGTTTPFWTGRCLSTDEANYNGNYPLEGCPKGKYREKTTPVKTFPANPWGLYDMHGNVWEWCADWFGDYPAGPVTDPGGPSTGSSRVLRGGSWNSTARICRSAYRSSYDPSYRGNRFGFRLALSPGR